MNKNASTQIQDSRTWKLSICGNGNVTFVTFVQTFQFSVLHVVYCVVFVYLYADVTKLIPM
jgi:hypothetical protein